MNKDQVKGTIDELVGGAKRETGKLTGSMPLQAKGMAQQVKGKLENALGNAKGAIREASQKAARPHDTRATVEPESSAKLKRIKGA